MESTFAPVPEPSIESTRCISRSVTWSVRVVCFTNGPSGALESVFIARCVTSSVLWMSSPSRSDTMLAAFSIKLVGALVATPARRR